MTIEELIEGLKTLDAPDQGMRYHGGGLIQRGPSFDDQTGERLSPRYKSAELTVHGERARFLYRLIENAPSLATALQPSSAADAKPVAWGYAARRIRMHGKALEGPWSTGKVGDGFYMLTMSDPDWEVVTLYAQPPTSQQAGTEGVFVEREALKTAVTIIRAFSPTSRALSVIEAALKPGEAG